MKARERGAVEAFREASQEGPKLGQLLRHSSEETVLNWVFAASLVQGHGALKAARLVLAQSC